MGLALSFLQKFGLSGITDKVFDSLFKEEITDFEKFHIQFIEACNTFNQIMPGKHVKAPDRNTLKEKFNKWKESGKDNDKLKKELLDFMVLQIQTSESKDNGLIMMTGLVAPAASIFLKRSGENIPQLKKLRINLVPDIVFVPSFTVLALVGAKMLQIKSAAKGS